MRIPPPPTMMNHGNWIVSVSELGQFWPSRPRRGAVVLPETAGQELLVDHGRVVGVRTEDKGRGKEGEPLFELRARYRRDREDHGPGRGDGGPPDDRGGRAVRPGGTQPADLGARRQGECGRSRSRCTSRHTMGWPLRKSARYGGFGGSWIYPMGEEHVTDRLRRRPRVLRRRALRARPSAEFKTHKLVRKILDGGERVAWGAEDDHGGRAELNCRRSSTGPASCSSGRARARQRPAPEGRASCRSSQAAWQPRQPSRRRSPASGGAPRGARPLRRRSSRATSGRARRGAEHAPGVRQGLLPRRGARDRDDLTMKLREERRHAAESRRRCSAARRANALPRPTAS